MKVKNLIDFLNTLEKNNIFYKLTKTRDESIMVEVAVLGQRWEIEFMDDDTIEVEKFIFDNTMYDEKELEILFRDFSD